MKTRHTALAALLLTTSAATAGGLDRTGNDYAVLFEDGNYVKLSFSAAFPEVSGDYPAALGGGDTGTMSNDFQSAGLALKYELAPHFDVGLFLNDPYGADSSYPQGAYDGLDAVWSSRQIAVVLKYQATPDISVYGGLRSTESEATITIPDALIRRGLELAGDAGNATAGDLAAGAPPGTLAYNAETDSSRETSYIVGVAYERPEIALRVALTYESGLTHDFEATEAIVAVPSVSGVSNFEIDIPQTVILDFQSGVAADTLVFGSIRWAEWSVWEVRPAGYEALTGDRVTGLDDDVFTYRIGVGRKINENLSVFGRVTYEDSSGGVASRLSPTDGRTGVGIGGTYSFDAVDITGGLEYIALGDATDSAGVAFTDNAALAVGLSVGYRF